MKKQLKTINKTARNKKNILQLSILLLCLIFYLQNIKEANGFSLMPAQQAPTSTPTPTLTPTPTVSFTRQPAAQLPTSTPIPIYSPTPVSTLTPTPTPTQILEFNATLPDSSFAPLDPKSQYTITQTEFLQNIIPTEAIQQEIQQTSSIIPNSNIFQSIVQSFEKIFSGRKHNANPQTIQNSSNVPIPSIEITIEPPVQSGNNRSILSPFITLNNLIANSVNNFFLYIFGRR